jgi:hypothetical protein
MQKLAARLAAIDRCHLRATPENILAMCDRKKVLPTHNGFRIKKGGNVFGQPNCDALHQLSP